MINVRNEGGDSSIGYMTGCQILAGLAAEPMTIGPQLALTVFGAR